MPLKISFSKQVKRAIIVVVVFLIIVSIVFMIFSSVMEKKKQQAEKTSSPKLTITHLSENSYVADILDNGYSNELPIDARIYFSTNSEKMVLPETVKVEYKKTDELDYASITAYMNSENFQTVYLSLLIENVDTYTDAGAFLGREDFRYNLVSRFNIESLEVLSLNNIETEENIYSIVEPYQYPIVPGTSQWAELQSLDEMIEACQIPENILSQMSTEALIETVINYPLAVNLFAFDTPQEGFESVNSYFNGMQELVSRPDALEKMDQYCNSTCSNGETYQMADMVKDVLILKMKTTN